METSSIQNDFTKISEINISYLPKFKASERPQISTSAAAFNVIKSCWNMNTIALKEEFKILLLNRNNKVLGVSNIASGGIAGVEVDPKLIFATAIKAAASSLIIFHNHPSGNLKPSKDDINLTNRLIAGGKLLDIGVFDHIIVTPENSFYSFSDEGLI